MRPLFPSVLEQVVFWGVLAAALAISQAWVVRNRKALASGDKT
jgi:hypothetical protein